MTTFTVYNPEDSSQVEGRGLTAEQAAEAILTYDGYAYEVREVDGVWQLFTSDGSANSPRGARHLCGTTIFAAADGAGAAWTAIAAKVLRESHNWRHGLVAASDADFDAMIAEEANG